MYSIPGAALHVILKCVSTRLINFQISLYTLLLNNLGGCPLIPFIKLFVVVDYFLLSGALAGAAHLLSRC